MVGSVGSGDFCPCLMLHSHDGRAESEGVAAWDESWWPWEHWPRPQEEMCIRSMGALKTGSISLLVCLDKEHISDENEGPEPFSGDLICVRVPTLLHPPNLPEIASSAYLSGCLGEDEPDWSPSEGKYTTCV